MTEETTDTAKEAAAVKNAQFENIIPEIETSDDAQQADMSEAADEDFKKGKSIDAMLNVGMNIQIVLGSSHMPIADLLKLSRGSIIELDKKIGEPVDVVINQSLIARGNLIKVGENRVGISLTEIVKDYILES